MHSIANLTILLPICYYSIAIYNNRIKYYENQNNKMNILNEEINDMKTFINNLS